MNLVGCAWLASARFMTWLFPVLLIFSALYLITLLRSGRGRGYRAFAVGLAGVIAILIGRTGVADGRWLSAAGIAMMMSSSLWNAVSRTMQHVSLGIDKV